MSFSGLKTALRRAAADFNGSRGREGMADLAASFQAAVCDVLTEKSARAIDQYLRTRPTRPTFCIAGGVAANASIRESLAHLCNDRGTAFVAPPIELCTDNAAMIAFAGLQKYLAGDTDDLALSARPRWPLDPENPALLGSGKKGPKA